MKIYVAGPMKGKPDNNYELFNEVSHKLRKLGHTVYNPAEYPWNESKEFPLREAFAEYCRYICLEADAIMMLPGHKKSKGASVELALAKICGIKVIDYPALPK